MAKGVINLQKESGGIVKISPVDGTGVTEVTVPESGNLVSVDTAVTDNAIARYDGTTGKLQNSGVIVDDSGNLTTDATLKATKVSAATGSDSVTIGGWDNVNHRVEYVNRPLKITGYGTNSDIIFANNNDSEKMRIDSAGRVTMPYQPSFYAYNISNNNVANLDYIKFNQTRHNIGGAYDTSTGRFTAPVKGVYHFNFTGITHAVSYYFYVSFAINGSALASSYVHLPSTEGEYSNLCTTCTLLLYANDFVNVVVGFNGGSPYFEAGRSHFSGHLIG